MMSEPAKPDYYSDMLRELAPMDRTEALRRIQVLVQSEPDLRAIQDDYSCPPETLKWLGSLTALVEAMKRSGDIVAMKLGVDKLIRTQGSEGSGEIRAVLYRALAAAEMAAPASEQGAFVAAGNELDAYAAISKVLASAKADLLVVDAYMDGKALIDFMPGAAEGVKVRVLADEASFKATLPAAASRWASQFDDARPLEVRLAPARTLHDRLILVDQAEAWSLTQSFKDFAQRAHGSILKADAEIAALKIAAYAELWNTSRPI